MSDEVPVISANGTTYDRDTHVSALGKSTQYHQIEVTDNSQAHLGDVHNFNYHVTVGTIATIIDVATRSITTLADVRNRFKEASMLVTPLSTQLVSIRTALNQIKNLIEESFLDDQHYQLVIDLDAATKGCHLLLGVLDEHISKLENSEGGQLTFKNRLSTILESRGVEQCLSRLDRQMLALNVIITAYTAREPFRQKQLLEARQARKVFQNVKNDTTSLFSLNFDFDAELMSHKAYKAAFRSLLYRNSGLRRAGTGAGLSQLRNFKAPLGTQRAEDKDRFLKVRQKEAGEIDTFLFSGHDVRLLLTQLALSYDEVYVLEKRTAFRQAIKATLSSVTELIEAEEGTNMSNDMKTHKATMMAAITTNAIDFNINPDAAEAIRFITKHLISNDQYHCQLNSQENYLFNNAERMLEPDYFPSVQDVLNLTIADETFEETYNILVKGTRPDVYLPIRAIHAQQKSTFPKRMNCLENATAFIHCVDLLAYAQVDPDSLTNMLTESLIMFESFLSRLSSRKGVILLFRNVADFGERLLIDPLSNYFPDYTGDNDVDHAVEYIFWQFRKADRSVFTLRSFHWNPSDPTNLRRLFGTIQDINLQRHLIRLGVC